MTKKHIHYDMKKLIWSILFLVTFLLPPGCYDEINNKLDELEGRVDDLTLLCDKLNKELLDAKYKALSSSSMLTEKCRESHVLEMLRNNKDSILHIADQPPYIINVPEK